MGLLKKYGPGDPPVKPYKPKSQADYNYRMNKLKDSSDAYNEFKNSVYKDYNEFWTPNSFYQNWDSADDYFKFISDNPSNYGGREGHDDFHDPIWSNVWEYELSEKPVQEILPYKPLPGKMPMRPMVNRPTQFLPKIDTSSKIEYNPLPTSSRSQTVLQYNPKTGKHFTKAIRVQPDAFFYTDNEWQDNSKPVVYYNPETKEYSEKPNYFKFKKGGNLLYKKGGSDIKIDPKKKGTFKSQATKMGMSVQKAAETILKNKEKYSPAMVKKANFARNFAK